MLRSTLSVSLVVTATALNTFPIVGVFTQPTTDTNKDCGGDCLYLAASYVKYVGL